MLPGTGVWFRVRDGHPVPVAEFDAAKKRARSTMDFTAVPRVAFLNGDQQLFDRATSNTFSTLDVTEQSVSVVVEGRAVGKELMLDAEFLARASCSGFTANLFPIEACGPASGADGRPVAANFGERIVPLTPELLTKILGACHLPADALARWNQMIHEAVSCVKADSATALVMNRPQVDMMLQMGLLPLHMLDPPACGWIEEGYEAPTNEAFDRLMERASALGLCSKADLDRLTDAMAEGRESMASLTATWTAKVVEAEDRLPRPLPIQSGPTMSAPLPPGTPSKLGFNTFAMWGLCAVVVGVCYYLEQNEAPQMGVPSIPDDVHRT